MRTRSVLYDGRDHHTRDMQSDQRRAFQEPGLTCWMLVSVPGQAEATAQSVRVGAGGARRRYYLLRLTGRLSLVWVCFFLLQPVRLYW